MGLMATSSHTSVSPLQQNALRLSDCTKIKHSFEKALSVPFAHIISFFLSFFFFFVPFRPLAFFIFRFSALLQIFFVVIFISFFSIFFVLFVAIRANRIFDASLLGFFSETTLPNPLLKRIGLAFCLSFCLSACRSVCLSASLSLSYT